MYRLSTWSRERRTVKRYISCFELWFFGNCSVKQPSGWFCLGLLWINLTENENHHHYSSPIFTIIIVFKEPHHFVNPGVILLICHGFCQVLQWFRLDFLEPFFESRYWSVVVNMLDSYWIYLIHDCLDVFVIWRELFTLIFAIGLPSIWVGLLSHYWNYSLDFNLSL